LKFDHIKELYQSDDHFSLIYQNFSKEACKGFFIHDDFIFRDKNLCKSKGSLQKNFIKEAYEGGLIGHFVVNKTLDVLKEHFYWSNLQKQV